jgi:methyl-accepting chemotaxis protein
LCGQKEANILAPVAAANELAAGNGNVVVVCFIALAGQLFVSLGKWIKRVCKAVAKCVESLKSGNLQRIASRHELESDEFSTAFQKALELI